MNEIPTTPGETEITTLVKTKEHELYERLEKGENTFPLRNETMQTIVDMYDISTETPIGKSTYHYVKDIVYTLFDDMIRKCQVRLHNKKSVYRKLDYLQTLDLPEQRSPEWYQMRNNVLTASSLADAIGKGHFKSRDDLLIEKTTLNPKPFTTNDILQWGVKYEPIATWFYEYMHDLSILEFGLVPHPQFPIFGASPDGIVKDGAKKEHMVGRMLEIKCPPKRVFTNEVPEHYWIQMQGQMETCDLEECDFLQVKFSEYLNVNQYIEDTFLEGEVIKEGYSSLNLPKGLVIAFIKYNPEGNPTIKYEYSEFYSSYDSITKWSENMLNTYKNGYFEYDEFKFHWWRIERYECTLVGRDRKWWLSVQPKIIDFWEDVLHHREVGIQRLLDAKEEKKTKRIKLREEKKNKKEEKKKNTFEIDKAVVEKLQTNYLIDSDSE